MEITSDGTGTADSIVGLKIYIAKARRCDVTPQELCNFAQIFSK